MTRKDIGGCIADLLEGQAKRLERMAKEHSDDPRNA
jgi:hypothetical protein